MIIKYLFGKVIIDKEGGKGMVIQASGRIKELRQSRGMTQTELAKIMSVTRSSVNAWEMGISVPTAAKLVELSLFFHVSTDYILGLETREFIALDGLDGEQKGCVRGLQRMGLDPDPDPSRCCFNNFQQSKWYYKMDVCAGKTARRVYFHVNERAASGYR